MRAELTNLLPAERIKAFRRDYFIRFATVSIGALSFVVLASSMLLVPSYLFLHQEIQSRQARVAELDGQLVTAGGDAATKQLAALTAQATYLSRLASTTTATKALGAVLAAPRPGILLTGFTFIPPSGVGSTSTPGKMTLNGTASTRETLRSYAMTLGTLPFVNNVDLPISAYAKEENIPFSITLTGTLLP